MIPSVTAKPIKDYVIEAMDLVERCKADADVHPEEARSLLTRATRILQVSIPEHTEYDHFRQKQNAFYDVYMDLRTFAARLAAQDAEQRLARLKGPRPRPQVRIPNRNDSVMSTAALFGHISAGRRVLLLDIRPRELFEEQHIDSGMLACLEPLCLRPNMTDKELEDTLVIAPHEEAEAFEKRQSAELVVMYDQQSESVSGSPPLGYVKNALERADTRVYVLIGGINAWVRSGRPTRSSNTGSQTANGAPEVPPKVPIIEMPLPPLQRQHSPSRYRQAQPAHNVSPVPAPRTASSTPSTNSSRSSVSRAPLPPSNPPPAVPQVSHGELVALSSVAGLKNMGNTCYMNCVTQCLLGVSRLVLPFLDGSYQRRVNLNSRLGYQGQLAREFSLLVRALSRPGVSYVTPYGLKQLSGRLRSDFSGYEQQDCQEFLTFLLDGLHEELNSKGDVPRREELDEEQERRRELMPVRVAATIEWERYLANDTSLIVDIFQGQYLSRLRCSFCSTTSTTYAAFSTLSLPIAGDSLIDCFNEFVKPEVLDGDNAWHCPKCKQPRRTLKTLAISRLPPVLIIHLKRFQRTWTSVDKLATPVRYPLHNLDLTAYWPATPIVDPHYKKLIRDLPHRGQVPPFVYDLAAVTVHQGTLKGGHYTAFVKKPMKGWCYFDDANVTQVPETAALSRNAYLLFYHRK